MSNMSQYPSDQINSIRKEFKLNYALIKEKQDGVIKRIRRAIDNGKMKRIKEDLGISE